MPTESTAALLRRAADHLDELAKGATTAHGPWLDDHTLPGDEACVMVVTNADKGWAQILFVADWGTDADARWIAALSPVVAAPLAAWLRDVAEDEEHEQQERTEHCPECDGTGQVYDGDPLPFLCSDCLLRRDDDWPPLAVARALLGEEAPGA